MEFPWELGPADGRYLLREKGGPDDGKPEHVVVLSTVGTHRRGLLGGRARTRATSAEPSTVPVARATVIDPISLSAESQAKAWLKELDPERESTAAATVLNRVLFAQRISAANPHVHEISARQALVVRAGYGEGEQVADGLWTNARELVLSHKRTRRRAMVLRPQERLAVLLSGRGEALLCEELTLRARLDLDGGRIALASIGLERAYACAMAELPREQRMDLSARISELRELQGGIEQIAQGALAPDREAYDMQEQTVRHALERLEAALRARTATGFATQPSSTQPG